eukprot:g16296.t1
MFAQGPLLWHGVGALGKFSGDRVAEHWVSESGQKMKKMSFSTVASVDELQDATDTTTGALAGDFGILVRAENTLPLFGSQMDIATQNYDEEEEEQLHQLLLNDPACYFREVGGGGRKGSLPEIVVPMHQLVQQGQQGPLWQWMEEARGKTLLRGAGEDGAASVTLSESEKWQERFELFRTFSAFPLDGVFADEKMLELMEKNSPGVRAVLEKYLVLKSKSDVTRPKLLECLPKEKTNFAGYEWEDAANTIQETLPTAMEHTLKPVKWGALAGINDHRKIVFNARYKELGLTVFGVDAKPVSPAEDGFFASSEELFAKVTPKLTSPTGTKWNEVVAATDASQISALVLRSETGREQFEALVETLERLLEIKTGKKPNIPVYDLTKCCNNRD